MRKIKIAGYVLFLLLTVINHFFIRTNEFLTGKYSLENFSTLLFFGVTVYTIILSLDRNNTRFLKVVIGILFAFLSGLFVFLIFILLRNS
jgi:hypothetical protein